MGEHDAADGRGDQFLAVRMFEQYAEIARIHHVHHRGDQCREDSENRGRDLAVSRYSAYFTAQSVGLAHRFPNALENLAQLASGLAVQLHRRHEETDIPGVFLSEQEKSRVVYFPWDIDRTFWEVSCVDHGRLLANAVDWASGDERPVTISGPGILDVAVWRQESSMTVHLVNLTNPMMMKGPCRELIPVGEQRVTVQLPEGAKARQVRLLRAGQTPQVENSVGKLKVIVPTILDHEVVAIDL